MAVFTQTYSSNFLEEMNNLKRALEPLIELGYFDKMNVSGSSDDASLWCQTSNNRTVIHIAQYDSGRLVVELFLYDEDTDTTTMRAVNFNNHQNYFCYSVYTTSHGAYIQINQSTSNSLQYTHSGCIISKTNNDKVGIFCIGLNSSANDAACRLNNTQAWALDDNASFSPSFAFPTVYLRNQTTLMNVPTAGGTSDGRDKVSYFPYVYYTFTSQLGYENNFTTPPCNIVQNGYRYLWVGYYMLRDDPPINS